MPHTKSARGAKTLRQVRTIFALARRHGLNDDELHAVVAETIGNRSISALGREDANRVIARLDRGSRSGSPNGNPDRGQGATGNYAALSYLPNRAAAPPIPDTRPRRTIQHHRQQAGIVAFCEPAQMHLIAQLASQRSWTGATLEKFIRRQCKCFPPRTTRDANRVIEALKAMNRRENLWAN